MHISDFDYSFPTELLAKHPPKVRGQSRLLVLDRKSGSISHRTYPDFAEYVNPGDTIILNNTKVIKARLPAVNQAGKIRELLLIEKHGTDKDWHVHHCLYRGRINAGEILMVGNTEIRVLKTQSEGLALVQSDTDLLKLAEQYGSVPLPPYIKRQATKEDIERYQTVFANKEGSVAAPTASLNFTEELDQKLTHKGANISYLTLHVGLGTFLPIRTDDIEKHQMHSEYFEIPLDTVRKIKKARSNGNKIIAVGTTVARTLEYCADSLTGPEEKRLTGEANIFIYPGYRFKMIDALLTNFHAPKSTVLMLAAAFAGWDNLRHAYDEAVKEKYAFLSYGDSMLIMR